MSEDRKYAWPSLSLELYYALLSSDTIRQIGSDTFFLFLAAKRVSVVVRAEAPPAAAAKKAEVGPKRGSMVRDELRR